MSFLRHGEIEWPKTLKLYSTKVIEEEEIIFIISLQTLQIVVL